jgi:hypothetical protein
VTYGFGRTGVDWSKDTDADGNEIRYVGQWILSMVDGSERVLKWKSRGKQSSCDNHWEGWPHLPCWRLVFAEEVTP